MHPVPNTAESLAETLVGSPAETEVETSIERLRAMDEIAWARFDGRYRPVLNAYARRVGLGATEAEELAQATLWQFMKALREGRFDPDKGSLSAYLFGIARHQIIEMNRRPARDRPAPQLADGQSFWQTVAGEQRQRALWEKTWAHARLRECLERLRASESETRFEAFRMRALHGTPAPEIARRLGLPTAAVYKATYQVRRRLAAMLKEAIHAEESTWGALSP